MIICLPLAISDLLKNYLLGLSMGDNVGVQEQWDTMALIIKDLFCTRRRHSYLHPPLVVFYGRHDPREGPLR